MRKADRFSNVSNAFYRLYGIKTGARNKSLFYGNHRNFFVAFQACECVSFSAQRKK